MGNVIKTFFQFVLLVIYFNGITAIIWSFDIAKRYGSFAMTDLYVGVTSHNGSMLKQVSNEEKKDLAEMLEKNEAGYDFNEEEIHKLNLWPQGIVPFLIDTVSYDKDYQNNLRHALTEINTLSGLHFKELLQSPEDDNYRYVYFINKAGIVCSDGFTNKQFTSAGVQEVALGFNSLTNGDLYSFVLAVAGIPPQSNAPRRDEYITVKEENIRLDKLHLFEALKNTEWLYHNLPYDYYSASHFDSLQYTKSGLPTTEAKFEVPPANIPGFTVFDIQKMSMTYNFLSDKDFKLNPTLKPELTTTLSNEKSETQLGNPDEPLEHVYEVGEEYTKDLENKKRYGSKSKYKLTKEKNMRSKTPKNKHNKDIRISNKQFESDDIKIQKKKVKLDQKHKKKGGVDKEVFEPRKKPNKFLGISEDEENRGDQVKSEELSEDINVYLSDASREKVKRLKRKNTIKRKIKRARVNVNV